MKIRETRVCNGEEVEETKVGVAKARDVNGDDGKMLEFL